MIFGWARPSTTPGTYHVGSYVLVDAEYPWPALHHGRNALRTWAAAQNAARRRQPAGPCYIAAMAGSGVTSAVKEGGMVRLRVWPVAKGGLPRQWAPFDRAWREPLTELRRFVGAELGCGTMLEWMPGGNMIERSVTAPSLQGVNGFYGWRRGEREPTRQMQRSINRGWLMAQVLKRPITAGEAQWL